MGEGRVSKEAAAMLPSVRQPRSRSPRLLCYSYLDAQHNLVIRGRAEDARAVRAVEATAAATVAARTRWAEREERGEEEEEEEEGRRKRQLALKSFHLFESACLSARAPPRTGIITKLYFRLQY